MPTKIERKSLESYLELKYPVTIIPDKSGGYVAEIEDLPGCITQGETLEETFGNVEEARRLWIESAYEDGQDIPSPKTDEKYSGKFLIRAPKSLHRKLYHVANEEGVSLNQFLVSTLAQAVGYAEGRQRSNAQLSNKKTKAQVI